MYLLLLQLVELEGRVVWLYITRTYLVIYISIAVEVGRAGREGGVVVYNKDLSSYLCIYCC